MAGTGRERRAHRSYRPAVEGLEALRLLSGAAHTSALPALAVEHQSLLDAPLASPSLAESPGLQVDAWDALLRDARLNDFLDDLGPAVALEPEVEEGTDVGIFPVDAPAMAAGLNQLDRYLTRSWQRAGLTPQTFEDSSQAVYATMLQQLGRHRFDAMLTDVGRWGVREVFSKETTDGQDFFRAVDMIKKRVQRERTYQPLDEIIAAGADDGEIQARRDALREAIDRSLSPREASLVQESLKGRTPAEIAQEWGVAPKTVSNEKTRVLNKLRDLLQTQLID